MTQHQLSSMAPVRDQVPFAEGDASVLLTVLATFFARGNPAFTEDEQSMILAPLGGYTNVSRVRYRLNVIFDAHAAYLGDLSRDSVVSRRRAAVVKRTVVKKHKKIKENGKAMDEHVKKIKRIH
jgi:hypothetical protein